VIATTGDDARYMLIDDANVEWTSSADVRQFAAAWLSHQPPESDRVYIFVRAYGGWWNELTSTQDRTDAAIRYADAAGIFREQGALVRLACSFADDLLHTADDHHHASEKAVPIRYTTVLRERAGRFSRRPTGLCVTPNCQRDRTAKFLSAGRGCTSVDCGSSFATIFSRQEQKQVDAHLAMDILTTVSTSHRPVAVVSDDADVLPALLKLPRQECPREWQASE